MHRTDRSWGAFNLSWWWVGLLTILLGLVGGAGCRSETEPESSSPLSSPLGTTLSSPLPMALASPLSTPSLTPSLMPSVTPSLAPSPSPTVLPTMAARGEVALALGVLHTNDTWGYLLPCG